jgi:NAD(P)-dependent dehydrogenase (short-subunit alcohol dehydrogenase family)
MTAVDFTGRKVLATGVASGICAACTAKFAYLGIPRRWPTR